MVNGNIPVCLHVSSICSNLLKLSLTINDLSNYRVAVIQAVSIQKDEQCKLWSEWKMKHDREQLVVLLHGPGQNQTFSQPEAGNHPYHMFRMIETYFLPLTCVVGLICNTLATKTFLDKKMRKFSCSMYLVTKCMSDSIFLLNMLVIYICCAFSVTII